MKKSILVLIILLTTSFTNAQNQNSEADALLELLVSEKKVVGLSGGYAIDGKTEWVSAKGFANKDLKTPFKVSTKTRTASIAKPMTAVAIMQLVEQGLIKLNEPIQTYFPDFPKKKLGNITVYQLLSQTSGLDSYRTNKERETKKNYASLEEATHIFRDWDLRFKPGTAYHYTTYGYTVLGVIIEKVSGLTFDEYMQKHIWDKADMQSTGVEVYGETIDNKSALYRRSKRGKIKEAQANNLSNRIPAGGFYTTIEDLLKFGNAILKNTLIKEETLGLMSQHHSLEKYANGYGFGWFLYGPKENEGLIIGHSGGQTGVSAQLFIIPKSKTVLAILANTSGSWGDVIKATGSLIAISEKKSN